MDFIECLISFCSLVSPFHFWQPAYSLHNLSLHSFISMPQTPFIPLINHCLYLHLLFSQQNLILICIGFSIACANAYMCVNLGEELRELCLIHFFAYFLYSALSLLLLSSPSEYPIMGVLGNLSECSLSGEGSILFSLKDLLASLVSEYTEFLILLFSDPLTPVSYTHLTLPTICSV
eukprot:TRINITY_DN14101_c0_g3_i2.p1 TRINITY_DN14101_c0_g3~~TRINITY_DN14101_c0_g3_i2.p1  ORF type:complete len:177 (+),score=6.81 TRINITY_DN14101_c0_g3_i2:1-531(+)